MLANIDDSPSKTVLLNDGFGNQAYRKEELYDLTFDPNEANNLVANPDYLDELTDMRSRLETWMQQTNDPLLSGDVSFPKGALVSKVEDKSPKDIWTYTEQPEGFA